MVKHILIFYLLLLYSINNFSQKIDTLFLTKNYKILYQENHNFPISKCDTNVLSVIPYGLYFNEYGEEIGCYCYRKIKTYNQQNILEDIKKIKKKDIFLNSANTIKKINVSYDLNYVYSNKFGDYDVTDNTSVFKNKLIHKLKKVGGYIQLTFYIENDKYYYFSFYHKPKIKKVKKLKKIMERKKRKNGCPKECESI